MIFQPPGYGVVIMPGKVYHWTVWLGANICEASNFFVSAGGTSLQSMFNSWCRHARAAVGSKKKTDLRREIVAARVAAATHMAGIYSYGTGLALQSDID